jgi:chromosome segregation protein
MPCLLKSFELHGYKTFASRAEFVFAEGITAIVGPNGSGKSNIADALRWVLGEQSYSLLRAKKTEDMIFAGSEHRPRAGMASATIVFDNSSGWLPIDFSEVGITRRAYRDGENEYLLNGQKVRLKDVTELLSQSGLAERTYTVIGQGLVDAALSLKAEERRRLFEEAAGIGLHRSRREEALRRLDTTHRNLERVEDILAELQPRLRSLERQARRAQEYEQVKADLRLLLREWYGYHWHQAQAELMNARDMAHRQEANLEGARKAQVELDQKLGVFRRQIQELRSELGGWHRRSAELHIRRENINREIAVDSERTRSILRQQQDFGNELTKLEGEITLHKERIESATLELKALQIELDEAHLHVNETQQTLQERREERSRTEMFIQSAQETLSALDSRQTSLQARLVEKQSQSKRQDEMLKEAVEVIAQAKRNLDGAENELKTVIQHLSEVKGSRKEIEDNLLVVQQQLRDTDTIKKELLEKRSIIQVELARQKAQLDVLKQAENNLSGYADGARILLQAMRQSRLEGALGALTNYIQVPVELESAIAAALGEYLDAMILVKSTYIDRALDILESESARGALLPLDVLKSSRSLRVEYDKAPGGRDVILGVAAELVTPSDELRSAVDLLLGHVIVVSDRVTARRVLAAGDWRNWPDLRIVTLKGELFYASGVVQRGSTGNGIINRPRLQRECQMGIDKLESEDADFQTRLQSLDDQASQMLLIERKRVQDVSKVRETERELIVKHDQEKLRFEKAKEVLQWQKDQYERLEADIEQGKFQEIKITTELSQLEPEVEKVRIRLREQIVLLEQLSLDDIQAQASYWAMRVAVAERAVLDVRTQIKERQGDFDGTQLALVSIKERLSGLEVQLKQLDEKMSASRQEEAVIAEEIEKLRLLIEPAEKELGSVEQEQSKWLSMDTETRQVLSTAEHYHAQARIALARRQEGLDSLRRRIEDDFGLVAFDYAEMVSGPKPLPIDGMVENLPKIVAVSPDLEEMVQRQRNQLRRMGAVNPEAQTEYQQVKERFEFLTDQVADLKKAEIDIKEVIAELDLLMDREFRKTFDAVAQEFRQIFTRLFGGGSARLVLTDPEDMTGTGIDIEARLPGRREQGLALLSGGERSLTAAALVFSLLRISPTPFCVLDEVDAMLDEANVGRFREMLLELSEHTQFIVITHNRNTVQVASVIYGITMGRDSASQMIGLKLDEVSEQYGV